MAQSTGTMLRDGGLRAVGATGRLLKRAGALAFEVVSWLGAEPTRQVVRMGSRRIEEMIESRRQAFIAQARGEAEVFVAEQIALIEAKVDEKVAEIEARVDQQIEKELRHKLRLLAWTLLAVVVMSLISLLYLALRKALGL